MRRDVSFLSDGEQVSGWLYVPEALTGKAPAIVMANAISAVKEITLPGYAERFCQAGFVVLVFDYRHYGGSAGEPRNHLVPHEQLQDIRNAITWLRAQPEVDKDNIGGWGLSIGGVHMLNLGAYDRRLKAVVSVATGLNSQESMLGATALKGLLGFINGDRDTRFRAGTAATYMPAVGLPGTNAAMPLQEAYDFYTEAMQTYAKSYENRITIESVEHLLGYHGDAAVHLISPTALLMIHGEKDLIPPELVRAVMERAQEPKKLVIYDCLHTDLYTRQPWVTYAADEAIQWFNKYLHNPRGLMGAPQNPERNKQIIQYFYDQTAVGNLAVYDELFAPEFVSYTSAAGQELRGGEAFKQANIMYMNAFPDFQTSVEYMVAEGSYVMVYGPASGTNTGSMFGQPPTNRRAEWTGMAIYRFNDDGKIDGRWQEFNGVKMFQDLGLIPAPGGAQA
ncbi:MAG: alpha/beta fold hydrolase [Anaerolineae bacterium]|uniref:alpha/beta fold hydrolase n=1 Tax=Candidatus Flexifilum breve TaxID=3140694 RepID=UPI001AD293D6|nr:alpha/beta fold hydrolase [Chloroflexota bacterium]MBN8637463.1 alpha/beta fold hydrolase [Anaerolineae bacterium]